MSKNSKNHWDFAKCAGLRMVISLSAMRARAWKTTKTPSATLRTRLIRHSSAANGSRPVRCPDQVANYRVLSDALWHVSISRCRPTSKLHCDRISSLSLVTRHPFVGNQSMNQISRIEQARRDAKPRQEMENRFNVIRKAWDLVEPDPYDRDPQWLRIAASHAAKAGRIPRRYAGELVIMMLAQAGYGRAIDHPAIERVDGVRRVILEPYESRCSMDTARRMAAEIAILLKCDASVSLCSWHYPGSTIRITLAPSPKFARIATVAPHSNGITNHSEVASVGQQWPHVQECQFGTRDLGAPGCNGSSPALKPF